MKRLGIALMSLFSLLAATAPLSARTSDRTALSLPGIPNFRLPSAGVVNTVFPAATGGRTPYTYSLSGLPPGITFSPSTRVASGTLPTVWIDTAYTIVYTVSDSAGATDSVHVHRYREAPGFSATSATSAAATPAATSAAATSTAAAAADNRPDREDGRERVEFKDVSAHAVPPRPRCR